VKSRQNLARVYLETGFPEKALEQIEIAVGLDTGSVDGFRILGRARDELGFLEEAVEAYRQALVLDSKDAWSMNNLGLVLITQDRWDEAVGPLARATQLKPDVGVFHNNLGMALELTGYSGGAETAYRKAVELDAGYQKAVTNLGRVSGRPDDLSLPVLDLVAMADGFSKQVEGWRTLAVK
jgi:superkiller protein 3